ncbi:MAG: IS21-like element helper ATPase IstB [Planctomycetota bacterium]|jgi:DNA replication protein DnaC
MNPDEQQLTQQLKALYLPFIVQHFQSLADEAARQQWTPVQYMARLVEGETQRRHDRHIARRIAAAHFPVIKTLDQFNWSWPKKINQAQVQNLFRLAFLKDKASVIFIGGVGLGKTHLATALGHTACLQGHAVLFTTAVEAINTLSAAQTQSRLKAELKKFLAPTLLVMDELGYLPIDKTGADLLFQIISGRYEKGSTVITTNQPYKNWARIFNNDSTITSAVLDRLLHHAETVVMEGRSYRMKDQLSES